MKLTIAIVITLIFSIATILSVLLVNLYIQQTSQAESKASAQLPTYTLLQVASHRNFEDCWIIINQNVYDVSRFLFSHPGGSDRIIPYCGQDATPAFSTQGGEGEHSSSARSQLKSLQIGQLEASP